MGCALPGWFLGMFWLRKMRWSACKGWEGDCEVVGDVGKVLCILHSARSQPTTHTTRYSCASVYLVLRRTAPCCCMLTPTPTPPPPAGPGLRSRHGWRGALLSALRDMQGPLQGGAAVAGGVLSEVSRPNGLLSGLVQCAPGPAAAVCSQAADAASA